MPKDTYDYARVIAGLERELDQQRNVVGRLEEEQHELMDELQNY